MFRSFCLKSRKLEEKSDSLGFEFEKSYILRRIILENWSFFLGLRLKKRLIDENLNLKNLHFMNRSLFLFFSHANDWKLRFFFNVAAN